MFDEVSTQGSKQPERMLKRIFGNPVASFLAWLLLGVALMLVALRASMAFVPLFEDQASEWLRENFDTHLFGLQGDWRGFTPQLRIESILFRHGSVEDIRVDIDLLGSLLARSPRVDGLVFTHAAIEFPRDFDLVDFLLNSQDEPDLLSMIGDARILAGSLNVRIAETTESLVLDWHMQSGKNSQGEIRLSAEGSEGNEGDDESIVIGYDLDRGLLNRRMEGAIWTDGRLTIPDSFTSLIGISGEISSLGAEIWMTGGRLSAIAEVRAESFRIGNFLIDSAEFFAKGKGTPWLVEGELERGTLTRRNESLDFARSVFSYDEHQRWRFNLPDQLIEDLTRFVVASGRDETLLVRWSERFAPSGNVSQIAGEKAKGRPLVLSARVEGLSAESWMGSPQLDQVDAQVVFASGAARVLIDSANPSLGLPKLFDQSVGLGATSGEVWVRFLPRYFGMRGIELRSAFTGGGEGVFNLNYSGPAEPNERQISARLEGYGIAAAESLGLLPKLLPTGIRDWLRQGIRDGVIEEGEILLSGYVRRQPPLPTLQLEMWLDWLDGVIAFHPSWPAARAVSGKVELTNKTLHGQVDRAELLGAPINDLRFEMPMKGPRVSLTDVGTVSTNVLVELIDSTPIASFVPISVASLETDGDVNYTLRTSLPLAFRASDIELELDLELDGVDLRMAQDDRLTAKQLVGSLNYHFPDEFTSDEIEGFLFGQPARLSLRTGESDVDQSRRIQAEVRSRIDSEFLSDLFEAALPVAGESHYAALIEIDPIGQTSPRIRVHSDLVGMEAELPSGLGKRADEAVPFLADLSIAEQGRSGEAWFTIRQRAGGAFTWKQSAGADPSIGGAIIIGEDHSSIDVVLQGDSGLRVLGGIPELTLTDLRRFDSPEYHFALPALRFEGFQLDRLQIGEFYSDDIAIEGLIDRDTVELSFTGEGLEGSWIGDATGFDRLEFARIHVQSASEDEAMVGDLIGDLDLTSLPEIDLSTDSLKIAEHDYGAWQFGLRQIDDGVKLVDLEAEARGLSIRATDDLMWRQLADGTHESRFVGDLATDDLASAMSAWGFAPSVEAERAQLLAEVSWSGVPWKPELKALNGEIDLTIRRGRFRDFDPGAGMKLLTLLDFNAFIRRLSFDFSDVFGEGVSFDEVRVQSQFDDGLMTMLVPAKIDGNGGRFRISGSINLDTQELDNQMEATLKISRSLPWLATYLALLGNPITGLSVVVVERVLRDRIEDVSTARFYVTGTLSEPEFSLTEVEEPEPLPEALLEPEHPDVEPIETIEDDVVQEAEPMKDGDGAPYLDPASSP